MTPPTGTATAVANSQPFYQAVPVTVTFTPVTFNVTDLAIGRDLQTQVQLLLAGPAPAGGLRVRVDSSSANVLVSADPDAAGTQQLEVVIAETNSASGLLYVQNVGQSSGTATLTVVVLTTPNPGYVPGTPATVNLRPSGFLFYCGSVDCTFAGDRYTIETTTTSEPVLLFLDSHALSSDLSGNLLSAQNVRGGYSVILPLSDPGALGTYRSFDPATGQPGNVITAAQIGANNIRGYFYFDPDDAGAGGTGTISFTLPAGSLPVVFGGQPYQQTIPVTVTRTLPGGGQNPSLLPGVAVTASSPFDRS